jgi:hypothetical protein
VSLLWQWASELQRDGRQRPSSPASRTHLLNSSSGKRLIDALVYREDSKSDRIARVLEMALCPLVVNVHNADMAMH